jgi:hypothetical protein
LAGGAGDAETLRGAVADSSSVPLTFSDDFVSPFAFAGVLSLSSVVASIMFDDSGGAEVSSISVAESVSGAFTDSGSGVLMAVLKSAIASSIELATWPLL